MAAGDAYSLRNYGGGAADTSLVADIGSTDTSFNITSGTGYPTTNFALFLDFGDPTKFEKVWVGNRSGGALTNVVRGADGSSAHAHSAGAAVRNGGMAQDFAEANTVAAALTTDGDLLTKGPTATTAPQRLARGSDHQFLRSRGASSPKLRYDYAPLVFASTAARDTEITAPVNGMLVVVTSGDSSDGLYQYNGTSWRKGPGWNAAWGLVASASSTSDQTGITTIADITFATATWTAITGRLYEITLSFRNIQNTSTGNILVEIHTGASGAGTVLLAAQGVATVATSTGPWSMTAYQTGSGSISVHVRASTSAGTLTIQNSITKGWFTVKDIGPTGNPA